MHDELRQRLTPRAIFELLDEANVASTTTIVRASALAEDHRTRDDRRRLIAVAMNLSGWMLRLEGEDGRRHPFFDDFLFGIRARANAGNVDLLLLTGASSQVSGEPTRYLDLCRRHGAEGIILGAFVLEEPELASLVSSGFPCVAIDTQLIGPRVGFVTSDNVSGAAAAVRHLIELGRKRIAYVGGWGSEPAHIDRRLGYESALDESGLELREEYVVLGGWLHQQAHALTHQLLALAEPPDAIFCASDVMAIGAMLAIEEAELRIPEDVALVGFDDSDYATMTVPSLTSVRQDRVGLGAAAVEAMLRVLDHPDSSPPSSVLPVELVVRESSARDLATGANASLKTPGERAEQAAIPSRLGIEESAQRLSAAAVYRLLGRTPGSPPKRPDEAPANVLRQEWRPEKRRLVALAIDTAPNQSFRHAFFDELFYRIRAHAHAQDIDLLRLQRPEVIRNSIESDAGALRVAVLHLP